MGKQSVNDETLLTFMAEVGSLMNSHPRTHVALIIVMKKPYRRITFCSDEETLISRQMSSTTRTCAAERGGSMRKL